MAIHAEEARKLAEQIDAIEADLYRMVSRLWSVRQALEKVVGSKVGHDYNADGNDLKSVRGHPVKEGPPIDSPLGTCLTPDICKGHCIGHGDF